MMLENVSSHLYISKGAFLYHSAGFISNFHDIANVDFVNTTINSLCIFIYSLLCKCLVPSTLYRASAPYSTVK